MFEHDQSFSGWSSQSNTARCVQESVMSTEKPLQKMFFNVCFLHLDPIKVGLAWITEEQSCSWRNTSTFGSRCYFYFWITCTFPYGEGCKFFWGVKHSEFQVWVRTLWFFLTSNKCVQKAMEETNSQYLWVVCTSLDEGNEVLPFDSCCRAHELGRGFICAFPTQQ